MTNFLQMFNKLPCKKRKQINKSKQKVSIGENSSKKAIINRLTRSDNKKYLVFILAKKNQNLRLKIFI